MSELAGIFLAHLAVERRDAFAGDAGLGGRLAKLVELAQAAWPAVVLDPASFVAHVAERVGDGDLETMRTADLYLACACAARDDRAILEFDAACIAPLDRALGAAGANAALIDEIKQLLRERMLVGGSDSGPAIGQYGGRGDLRGWVQVAAVREVVRARGRAKREVLVDDDQILDRIVARDDPEVAGLRAEAAGELRVIFRAAMARLTPRERNLLRLHFLDALSIDGIGRLHDVHRSTAARWLVAAERRLQREVRKDMKARFSATTTELAGLWELVDGQLELSIHSMLGATTEG